MSPFKFLKGFRRFSGAFFCPEWLKVFRLGRKRCWAVRAQKGSKSGQNSVSGPSEIVKNVEFNR